MSRIAVVAFSGGLDTSCIVSWLKEDWYGFDEVVAVLVDVGQEFDLEASIERGRAGADDVVLVDRKAAFAEEQCARAIKTNALYEGKYPLVSALSRPVIAQAVAELAVELGAEAVVHGCTGKGNDQLRFELSFKATDPGLHVIAPLRDRIWTRDEEIEYALAKGIPSRRRRRRRSRSTRTSSAARSRRACSRIPGRRRPRSRTRSRATPPGARADRGDDRLRAGVPVSLDGEELPLAELIAQLNALAGPYGIGRIDMIENRAVGIKSREVYEAPAAIVLIEAHSALEDVVLTKDEARIKRGLEQRWTELVYEGLWFSPAREAIDAFVDKTQELVEGEVRVELRRTPPSSPAAARRTCSTPSSWPRTAPARRSRTRPPRASSRSPRSRSSSRPPASGRRRGMAALGGRVGRPLDPAGVAAFLRGRRRRAAAVRLRGDRGARPAPPRRGLLDDAELAEAEARLAEIAVGGGIEPEDEDVHTAIERLLGDVGRKIHAGGRETIRSRRRSGSTSPTR